MFYKLTESVGHLLDNILQEYCFMECCRRNASELKDHRIGLWKLTASPDFVNHSAVVSATQNTTRGWRVHRLLAARLPHVRSTRRMTVSYITVGFS